MSRRSNGSSRRVVIKPADTPRPRFAILLPALGAVVAFAILAAMGFTGGSWQPSSSTRSEATTTHVEPIPYSDETPDDIPDHIMSSMPFDDMSEEYMNYTVLGPYDEMELDSYRNICEYRWYSKNERHDLVVRVQCKDGHVLICSAKDNIPGEYVGYIQESEGRNYWATGVDAPNLSADGTPREFFPFYIPDDGDEAYILDHLKSELPYVGLPERYINNTEMKEVQFSGECEFNGELATYYEWWSTDGHNALLMVVYCQNGLVAQCDFHNTDTDYWPNYQTFVGDSVSTSYPSILYARKDAYKDNPFHGEVSEAGYSAGRSDDLAQIMPYVGMPERFIRDTVLGSYSKREQRTSRGVVTNCYSWNSRNGRNELVFEVTCQGGEVVGLWHYNWYQNYWSEDTDIPNLEADGSDRIISPWLYAKASRDVDVDTVLATIRPYYHMSEEYIDRTGLGPHDNSYEYDHSGHTFTRYEWHSKDGHYALLFHANCRDGMVTSFRMSSKGTAYWPGEAVVPNYYAYASSEAAPNSPKPSPYNYDYPDEYADAMVAYNHGGNWMTYYEQWEDAWGIYTDEYL